MSLIPVYPDPKSEPCARAEVDIIAVHGLGPPDEDSKIYVENVWSTSFDAEDRMWLRNTLPQDLPGSRIFLYLYDASAAYLKNKDTFIEKATELLEAIQRQRYEDNSRPIIFLGHSFGGLLIKQALINVQEKPQYTPLQKAILGLAFFATPHSVHNELGEVAAKIATITGQANEATQLLEQGGIFSELETDNKDKRWQYRPLDRNTASFQGDSEDIALHRSACLYPPENNVTLSTNYNDVCKFGLRKIDGDDFKKIDDRLRGMYEKALSLRFARHYIPLPRNDKFVGRNAMLSLRMWLKEHSKLPSSRENSRFSVLGREGVGKTQVALEFAYWVKDNYPEYSIFWFSTQRNGSSEKAYFEIAAQLHDRVEEETGHTSKQQVCKYLESEASGKWLAIVDNTVFLTDLPTSNEQGLILVIDSVDSSTTTTKSKTAKLEPIDPEEATELFNKLIGKPSQDKEKVKELCNKLNYFPLAIRQATAYLNQNQEMTILIYSNLLEKARSDKGWVFWHNTEDDGFANSVTNTLSVSFHQIKKSDSDAVALLGFLSCIESKNIPLSILPGVERKETKLAINTLCAYGFLAKRKDETFDMHSLVHAKTRIWVRHNDSNHKSMANALSHLKDLLSSDNSANRNVSRDYDAHISRALDASEDILQKEIREARYALLYRFGCYLKISQEAGTARKTLEKAYKLGGDIGFSEDDVRQIRVEHSLATACINDGREEERIAMLEHVVGQRKNLPEDDFDRLESEKDLAEAYQGYERINEAIKIFDHIMVMNKARDKDDDYRLISEINLGKAYLADGQTQKALELLEPAINVRETLGLFVDQGPLSPEYSLARAYLDDGQTKSVIKMLKNLMREYGISSPWVKLLAEAYRPKYKSLVGKDDESPNISSESYRSPYETTSCLPAIDVKWKLDVNREEWFDELKKWLQSTMKEVDLMISSLRDTNGNDTLKVELNLLRGKVDGIMESQRTSDMASKLAPVLLGILEHMRTIFKISPKRLSKSIRRLEMDFENINRLWDVMVLVDLNDFSDLLDDEIHSFFTITGSQQDAFANSAFRYVSWCWGQKGVDVFSWVSLVSSMSSIRVHPPAPITIHDNEGDDYIEVELFAVSDNTLRKWDTLIRIRWIRGTAENYHRLVADIASELSWIATVFHKASKKDVSFTRANKRWLGNEDCHHKACGVVLRISCENDTPISSSNKDTSTCWHRLFVGFNVAIGFPIPPRPKEMRGLELPLSVMLSFAQVDYAFAYGGGYVLKGWENALLPTRTDPVSSVFATPSAMQWHLLTGGKSRLYMMEAEEMPGNLRPVATKISSKKFYEGVEQVERHFLGLYELSKIRVGTDESSRDTFGPEITNQQKHHRFSVTWTKALSFAVSLPIFAGVGLGVSAPLQFTNAQQQLHELRKHRTTCQILDSAKKDSVILYDLANKIAWMLPKISVVMYLIQSWAKGRYDHSQINYPTFDDVIRQDWNVAQFLGQPTPDGSELKETFDKFMMILDVMQNSEDLMPARLPLDGRKLAGLGFAQLSNFADDDQYNVIRESIDVKYSGEWLQMLKSNWKDKKPYRVPTLFCSSLQERPIIPTVATCKIWNSPPVNYSYLIVAMHCLRQLAKKRGKDPVRLSENHYWKCNNHPFMDCSPGSRSCDRLQRIVEGSGEGNETLTLLMETASANAAVIFGGISVINKKEFCEKIDPPIYLATTATSSEVSPTTHSTTLHVDPAIPNGSSSQSSNYLGT